MATNVCGAIAQRVHGEEDEHHGGRRRSRRGRPRRARRSPTAGGSRRRRPGGRSPVTGAARPRRSRRGRRGWRRRARSRDVINSPACGPSGDRRPKKGGNWPTSASIARQPARGVERRVDGRGRRQEGGDRHDREARVAERRPRSLGDRRLAVADDLLDGQRAEDAQRDQDVRQRRDAEREIHRRRATRAPARAGLRRRR